MIKALIIFLSASILFCLIIHLFPINITASMPYGIYMRVPAKNLKVGDYVEVKNPLISTGWGVENYEGLCKRITEIKDELYFVMGEHPLSYDSRYFGYIGKEYITYKLFPIFTFNNEKIPKFLLKKE